MPEEQAPQLIPLVRRVHERLRPHDTAPIEVAFYPYVDTKSTVRHQSGRIKMRLSDHLVDAPDAVLEGVVSVLLCRMYSLPESRADTAALEAYKQHVSQPRFEARRHESRRLRGRKHIDPLGTHRSLLESYLRVSLDMGLALPETPVLSWSRTPSHRRFGHWDPAHSCIVISRILDDPRVPEYVLDYVVYHELLHILHPVEYSPGRRRIHTPDFLRDEARFPKHKEAEAWIQKLSRRGAAGS